MKYNYEKHRRRSIRLQGHDYSDPGAYFVTICTWDRECIFGEIIDGKMELNEYGKIAKTCLEQVPDHFRAVTIDEYMIMPNHVHGILIINAGNICRGMACHAPTARQFAKPVANSLWTIVGAFKSAVTKSINIMRDTPGTHLWQRNYFERIIRNEKELCRIREYIRFNPVQWDMDKDNPANLKTSRGIAPLQGIESLEMRKK